MKRFIAGAVCPICQSMDRTVLFIENKETWRQCIACEYRDRMPENDLEEPAVNQGNPIKIIFSGVEDA